jgi:hypothetical protein
MPNHLTGLARTWCDNLTTYTYTWEEWKTLLIRIFPDHVFASTLRQLMDRVKQSNETMTQYYLGNWTFSRYVTLTIRRLIRTSLMDWWITLWGMMPSQSCCVWSLPSYTGRCVAYVVVGLEPRINLNWNRTYWVDFDWNWSYWVDLRLKQILLSWFWIGTEPIELILIETDLIELIFDWNRFYWVDFGLEQNLLSWFWLKQILLSWSSIETELLSWSSIETDSIELIFELKQIPSN